MRRLSPPEEHLRLTVAEAIARKWNAASLGYAVVHGLEHYPSRLGRDLDIAIHEESVRPAVALAIKTGREFGFDTALFRWSHWGLYQLALVDREASLAVALDLLCTTRVWRAKWVRIVNETLFDQLATGDGRAGPFAVSSTGRFLKSFVRPVLCGDLSRVGADREWAPPPLDLPRGLNRDLLGDILGARLLDELLSGQATKVLRPELGGCLQHRWVRVHPFAAMRSGYDAGVSRLQRAFFDAAACLVVHTPSPQRNVVAALDALTTEAARLFLEVRLDVMPRSLLARLGRTVAGWRRPSVSEFAVTVVLDARPHGHGRCLCLQPTTHVVLPEHVSVADAKQTVRTCLLDFLATTYSPKRFLTDRRRPRPNPRRWEARLSGTR